MLNYYEAMDFDRNILLLVEKLRFVDLDYYNMIEVKAVAGQCAAKPVINLNIINPNVVKIWKAISPPTRTPTRRVWIEFYYTFLTFCSACWEGLACCRDMTSDCCCEWCWS